jgi:hypothetical protein
MAEEIAYLTCKVPGCGAKYYLDVDLYHHENNKMIDEEALKNRCRISGNLTNKGCLFYEKAYNNTRPGPRNVPTDSDWEPLE